MKNYLLLLMTALLGIINIKAKVAIPKISKIDSVKTWSISGQNSLLINQTAFSNWMDISSNNIGWNVGGNYSFTYEKGKDLWKSNIILGYGQNTKNRKTQDIININTNYGRKFSKNWYMSGDIGFISQFAYGYENNDPNSKKKSKFMAPGYLSIGIGITYKPNSNFTMTLRPANSRWIFVMDRDLQVAGNHGLKNDGDSSLFQFGFLGTASYKLKLMENITLNNYTAIFSNYLDHPYKLVLFYGGAISMKINKCMSANLNLDLIYDIDEPKKIQLRETLGVGLVYNFNNDVNQKKYPIQEQEPVEKNNLKSL